jgi:hypothetical protein
MVAAIAMGRPYLITRFPQHEVFSALLFCSETVGLPEASSSPRSDEDELE